MDKFPKEEFIMTIDIHINHAEKARGVFDSLKNRTIYFACSDIFGDPAWEIVTVLFLTTEQKRLTTTREISDTAHIPISAVSRWLRVLEKEQLVECVIQPDDAHNNRYRLTEQAVGSFQQYLDGNLS